MHDDISKLWMLLQIHRELIGHPRLKSVRMQIEAELEKYNSVEPAADVPAPIYPPGSGVTETDTASVPTYADRRA